MRHHVPEKISRSAVAGEIGRTGGRLDNAEPAGRLRGKPEEGGQKLGGADRSLRTEMSGKDDPAGRPVQGEARDERADLLDDRLPAHLPADGETR